MSGFVGLVIAGRAAGASAESMTREGWLRSGLRARELRLRPGVTGKASGVAEKEVRG